MKTTIEIADPILDEARKAAQRESTTLRSRRSSPCYRRLVSEFERCIEGWRRRWRQQQWADAAAASRARATADRLARYLRDEYGVHRVILVGSLARGELHAGSDIDLVAEGLPPESLFRAGAEVEAIAAGIPVDLVPIESAATTFLDDLEREGIVLHDERSH